MNDTILVVGGTGLMGGAVIERLLQATDASLVIPTRDARSERASKVLALSEGRVRMVEGDLSDDAHLDEVMSMADAVFCNTNFFAANSPVAEYTLGRRILDSAHTHGMKRFVYSSLDDALALTQGAIAVPHYDGKAAVAAYINLMRSEEMMQRVEEGWFSNNVSILTTAPYFENLTSGLAPSPATLSDAREGLRFTLPFGEGAYPMISLQDIGWFTAYMFAHWQSWGSRDLAVVGDRLTGRGIAESFEKQTGIPSEYQDLPLEVIIDSIPHVGHDLAAMSALFQARDITIQDRDLNHLRSLHPGLMNFQQWMVTTGWRGAPVSP